MSTDASTKASAAITLGRLWVAYRGIRRRTIVWRLYTRASGWSVGLWACSVAYVILFCVFVVRGRPDGHADARAIGAFFGMIMGVLGLAWLGSFRMAIRKAYPNFEAENDDPVGFPDRRMTVLRYYLFRRQILRSRSPSPLQLDALVQAAGVRVELDRILFSRPVPLVLVMALLALLIGGAASQASLWNTPWGLFLLITLLMIAGAYYLIHRQLAGLWLSRAYRQTEFSYFLLLLKTDLLETERNDVVEDRKEEEHPSLPYHDRHPWCLIVSLILLVVMRSCGKKARKSDIKKPRP